MILPAIIMTTSAVSLPKISIITPSFNQGNFIQQTIDSVLGQKYPNLEYIIIDGGSTDGTLKILKEYKNQLQWISEKDNGQSEAINKGLKISSGDILAFLNSDDVYEPGSLEKVGRFFTRHIEAKWVTGKCFTIDHLGRKTRPLITMYKNIWLHLNFSPSLFVLNFISQPATFWRREITERIGYLNELLFYTMDYEYWLRMIKVSKYSFINSYLASFRYYPNSKSGSTASAQFEEQFKVANESTTSSALLKLHRLHNRITTYFYQRPPASTGR